MTLQKIAERYGLTSDGVDFALSQYQIVISEITHGMMSKLSYYAKDIIQVAQDRWCDTCDLKAVSGWISVKDRLPEEDVDVLAYNGAASFIAAYTTNPSKRWYAISGFTICPTHWMPLPSTEGLDGT